MNKRYTYKEIFFSLVILLISVLPVAGQEAETEYEHRTFQFTFLFPPLSTNGINNINCINDFSINSFIGLSGGVGAFEAAGFINIDRKNVTGIQVAGFGNTVGDYVNGVQAAGFYNVNGTFMEGVQAAGFINVAGSDVTGVQAAGFINFTGRKLNGVQAAGFMNIAGETATSAQAAGFGNVSVSGSADFQASGFFNVATEVEGAQIAGFINVAGKVKGVQIAGFINICDSIEGVPIGFISIVKQNGYRRLEISVSEIQYLNLSYKMGVKELYTIYSFGKPFGDRSRWMYGAGLGTELDLSDRLLLNIEGTVHQELWVANPEINRFLYIDRVNLYNTAKFIFGWKTNSRASLHLGPTFNVGVSGDDTNSIISDHELIAPYSFLKYRSPSNNTTTQIWFGFQGGIRF